MACCRQVGVVCKCLSISLDAHSKVSGAHSIEVASVLESYAMALMKRAQLRQHPPDRSEGARKKHPMLRDWHADSEEVEAHVVVVPGGHIAGVKRYSDEDAEAMLYRALRTRVAKQDPSHVERASCHAAIADWFWCKRDAASALGNYEEALRICRASETGMGTALAAQLTCFKVAALLSLGRWEEAEAANEEAKQLAEAIFSAESFEALRVTQHAVAFIRHKLETMADKIDVSRARSIQGTADRLDGANVQLAGRLKQMAKHDAVLPVFYVAHNERLRLLESLGTLKTAGAGGKKQRAQRS